MGGRNLITGPRDERPAQKIFGPVSRQFGQTNIPGRAVALNFAGEFARAMAFIFMILRDGFRGFARDFFIGECLRCSEYLRGYFYSE